MSNQPPPSLSAEEIDIYKLEYERAATRYEDIYKASWTNFSYLAAVSGAILAFGGDKFEIEIMGILASIPLLFWYWATFEPLNQYGDDVVKKLSEIEETFNSNVLASRTNKLNLFSRFKDRVLDKEDMKRVIGLTIIIFILVFLAGLAFQKNGSFEIPNKAIWILVILCLATLFLIILLCNDGLRVRYVIRSFFIGLHIVVLMLIINLQKDKPSKPEEVKSITITLKDGKGEVKLTEIDIEKLNEILKNLGSKTSGGGAVEDEKNK